MKKLFEFLKLFLGEKLIRWGYKLASAHHITVIANAKLAQEYKDLLIKIEDTMVLTGLYYLEPNHDGSYSKFTPEPNSLERFKKLHSKEYNQLSNLSVRGFARGYSSDVPMDLSKYEGLYLTPALALENKVDGKVLAQISVSNVPGYAVPMYSWTDAPPPRPGQEADPHGDYRE